MSNFQDDYSDSVKIAHIKGKYKVACAILALVGGIIGALGGSKLGPIDINIHSDDYVGTAGQEVISQQESTIANLQNTYNELQAQNTALQEENQTLQAKLDAALAELEGSSSSQTQISAPNTAPVQTTGAITKLTALPLLGNNNDYYNHVYNTAENKDSARSSLGDVFNSSISMGADGDIDYFLGNAYQTLSFTLCISESTKNIDDHSSSITIYSVEGNGENESLTPIYSSPFLTMGFIPEVIGPIDVTGVEHLRISFYGDGKINGMPRIILGNPELT